jgi:hypothetical protein
MPVTFGMVGKNLPKDDDGMGTRPSQQLVVKPKVRVSSEGRELELGVRYRVKDKSKGWEMVRIRVRFPYRRACSLSSLKLTSARS